MGNEVKRAVLQRHCLFSMLSTAYHLFFKQLITTLLYNVRRTVYSARHCGGVAEWLKAPVLKTG
ncbi:hypothetical protein, partial [Pectobacterium versatile]|uniref:hypothetical protein n=1 Tax=Pectobacterium versatile TaxID=2488639 RepID=UPI001B373C54